MPSITTRSNRRILRATLTNPGFIWLHAERTIEHGIRGRREGEGGRGTAQNDCRWITNEAQAHERDEEGKYNSIMSSAGGWRIPTPSRHLLTRVARMG